MMSNIVQVEATPQNLPVGLALEVVYDDVNDDISVPKFRPVRS
jgi:hypothetical protein